MLSLSLSLSLSIRRRLYQHASVIFPSIININSSEDATYYANTIGNYNNMITHTNNDNGNCFVRTISTTSSPRFGLEEFLPPAESAKSDRESKPEPIYGMIVIMIIVIILLLSGRAFVSLWINNNNNQSSQMSIIVNHQIYCSFLCHVLFSRSCMEVFGAQEEVFY